MKNKDFDYKKDLVSKFPELKKIEGFPIGEDKDILALSEPPFYTACPNPYMTDFIREHGNPYNEATDDYHCEPFVGDVSEGKNDPIYNAHSYHTKVPHKAIMQYINHYTKEGEIVFDGFSGSGMTGVASLLLKRKSILSDISPIATFISKSYTQPTSPLLFDQQVRSAINKVKAEMGWVYETNHTKTTKGVIESVIWSDMLICPYCSKEYIFWSAAVKNSIEEGLNILEEYHCENCEALISKSKSKKYLTPFYDELLRKDIEQIKHVPVLINYSVGTKKFQKKLDEDDLKLLEKIQKTPLSFWVPTNRMPEGDESRRNDRIGVFNVHHFYTKRNLLILSFLNTELKGNLKFFFTSLLINTSKMGRWGKRTGNVSGTLYVPSLIKELNILQYALRKLSGPKGYIKPLSTLSKIRQQDSFVTTQSSTDLNNIPDNSIDYIFVDPPFGSNLMYSELNFIQEAWLKVFTNNNSEAIINKTQQKRLSEYQLLITKTFEEYFRILKPKRWITVEFHNTKSSVWNSIQEAITKSGFIIAQVSVLDKVQGSFKQVTAPGAVEKDLVISAYKPNKIFEEKFLKQAGENLEVDFVYQFLENLPKRPSVERTDKMLYSKMLAYYIQRGYEVRQDSKSFYRLLTNNFIPEDGFWFTPKQISSYREFKQKMKLEGLEDFKQGSMMLFITDESSALLWLFNFLSEPKTFSESSTAFNQLAEIQGDKVPDLKDMLNENFVLENNKYRRPQGEAETVSLTEKKERALMREFEILLLEAKSSKKKIAMIRKEAVLYGFEVCYKQNRFEDMLTLANRLDRSILENSSELTEFVEIARIKVEGIK